MEIVLSLYSFCDYFLPKRKLGGKRRGKEKGKREGEKRRGEEKGRREGEKRRGEEKENREEGREEKGEREGGREKRGVITSRSHFWPILCKKFKKMKQSRE
jgi:hypothetical protein